jgi:hypothetical protein
LIAGLAESAEREGMLGKAEGEPDPDDSEIRAGCTEVLIHSCTRPREAFAQNAVPIRPELVAALGKG